MAQLKFDAPEVPDFRSSNALLVNANNSLNQAGKDLSQSLTDVGTKLENENTDKLVQQMIKAGSQDELNAIDTNVPNVNQKTLNEVLYNRGNDFQQQENFLTEQGKEAEKIELGKSRLALDREIQNHLETRKSQVQYMRNDDGTAKAYQMDGTGNISWLPEMDDNTPNPPTAAELAETNRIKGTQLIHSLLGDVGTIADPAKWKFQLDQKFLANGIKPTPELAQMAEQIIGNATSFTKDTAALLNRQLTQDNVAASNLASRQSTSVAGLNNVLQYPMDVLVDPEGKVANNFTSETVKNIAGQGLGEQGYFQGDVENVNAALAVAKKHVPGITEKQFMQLMNNSVGTTRDWIFDRDYTMPLAEIERQAKRLGMILGNQDVMSSLRSVKQGFQAEQEYLKEQQRIHNANGQAAAISNKINGTPIKWQPQSYKVDTPVGGIDTGAMVANATQRIKDQLTSTGLYKSPTTGSGNIPSNLPRR